MLDGRQTIFLTPYFQFENKFDFLFVYVMNTSDYCLCLLSWHHGKRRKLSWKVMEKSWNFIIRLLWEPCTSFLMLVTGKQETFPFLLFRCAQKEKNSPSVLGICLLTVILI